MTQEEIIRMAREAGFRDTTSPIVALCVSWEQVERFAALVAAEKEKQIIDMLERLQERNKSHNYYSYAINVMRARI